MLAFYTSHKTLLAKPTPSSIKGRGGTTPPCTLTNSTHLILHFYSSASLRRVFSCPSSLHSSVWFPRNDSHSPTPSCFPPQSLLTSTVSGLTDLRASSQETSAIASDEEACRDAVRWRWRHPFTYREVGGDTLHQVGLTVCSLWVARSFIDPNSIHEEGFVRGVSNSHGNNTHDGVVWVRHAFLPTKFWRFCGSWKLPSDLLQFFTNKKVVKKAGRRRRWVIERMVLVTKRERCFRRKLKQQLPGLREPVPPKLVQISSTTERNKPADRHTDGRKDP